MPDFSQITERNGQAVVNITVSGSQRTSDDEGGSTAQPRMPFGIDPDDPFYEFFKRFLPQRPHARPAPQVPMRGVGSGFIISPTASS